MGNQRKLLYENAIRESLFQCAEKHDVVIITAYYRGWTRYAAPSILFCNFVSSSFISLSSVVSSLGANLADANLADAKLASAKSSSAKSAYVHIPFCRRRCFYCDFAVSVVGDKAHGENSTTIAQYVETLVREIEATPVCGGGLQTVFFGGGTPSLLSVRQLDRVLSAIAKKFGIASTAEISMEIDPATFNFAQIQGYRLAGVNRVSLGAQAFDDKTLAAAGRFHRAEDIFQAVVLLRQAQVENFSLDLISGLPHQTIETWQETLDKALSLNPTHISNYDLIVEPQTAFARYYEPGKQPLPSDDTTTQMYRMAQQRFAEARYNHYEICNYAKPGYEARHNLTYWRSEPCYGFGMGATSYLNHQRIDRPRTQKTYKAWVNQFVASGGVTADPVLPIRERLIEQIMVGLRLREGISLVPIHQAYGDRAIEAIGKAIAPHIQSGWLTTDRPEVDANIASLQPTHRIRLTDPEGFLMSNVVIVDAFNALESFETSQFAVT